MSVVKKTKKETVTNVTRRMSWRRESKGNQGKADSCLSLYYLMVFLVGELRAEVFPGASLNSLPLPSLVLASPRGLQFPLPVTQPPDSMP